MNVLKGLLWGGGGGRGDLPWETAVGAWYMCRVPVVGVGCPVVCVG